MSTRFTSLILILAVLANEGVYAATREQAKNNYVSGIGDPGMIRDGLRVAIEAWNQCNEVGEEAPGMGSPRMADCFDIDYSKSPVEIQHKVKEEDNRLGIANGTEGGIMAENVNAYAAEKEIYLGEKCRVMDEPRPWQFWMIMVKSGNMDTMAATCPKNGKKSEPFPPEKRFPCFGKGCMNMPNTYHEYSTLKSDQKTLTGSFYGTWDLEDGDEFGNASSFFKVEWSKKVGNGSWLFHHLLKTSSKYPWLMLYLRSDAATGLSAGYHYRTRGMTKIIPRTPDFKVKFRLEVRRGGGPRSQFYLLDIGGCWKNNGEPCDGNVTTDVTRYSEMIINPEVEPWCGPNNLAECPPHHTLSNGTKIDRTDNQNFPYAAYHLWCGPGNAEHLEEPKDTCDPYSNPQAQEILQILPHPIWGEYGYPTKKGQGWIGDPRTWELEVGKLSQTLYFYQDPETKPVTRYWPSVNLGTEIYISPGNVAEWIVSDFDIMVPAHED